MEIQTRVQVKAVRRNFLNGAGWNWYLWVKLPGQAWVELPREYPERDQALNAARRMGNVEPLNVEH